MNYTFSISEVNTKYLRAITTITGMQMDSIVNAALDRERDKNADLVKEIDALTARIRARMSEQEETKKEAPAAPAKKRPGRKPKKVTVDELADEIEQREKMSKEEFIEYFSGKQIGGV